VAVTRKELGAVELRREAGRCRDAKAARRMLALALVLEGVPVHGFETPICAYAALASGPIWSARTWAGVL
jgi:hypothetical protein